MSKNSSLKRCRNVFEGFSFQEDAPPIRRADSIREQDKFKRQETRFSINAIAESITRNHSSQDSNSPWLEKRLPSVMDAREKAKNIALAMEQRKKSAKNDLMRSQAPIRSRSLSSEDEGVTRFVDDEVLTKNNSLGKALSKSNLIRNSLLNQSIDDLEEYDPVDSFRSKLKEAKVLERQQRVQQKQFVQTPPVPQRQNRIVIDDSDDEIENLPMKVPSQKPMKRIDTDEVFFNEDTPQDYYRTKNNLSKLSKNQNQSQTAVRSSISLLDSDEEEEVERKVTKKVKRQDKSSTARRRQLVEEDESDNGDVMDEDTDEIHLHDDMTQAEMKAKALEIIQRCETLSLNLRQSLQRWEGKASNPSPSSIAASTNPTPTTSHPTKDCINLIALEEESVEEEEERDVDKTMIHKKLIKQQDFQEICPELQLKSYQLVGINWLNLLYEHQMNGVLADDMGLGKTIQTIAFLTYLSKLSSSRLTKRGLVHCIVVPASTLSNWENEFHRFAPTMSIIKYHGSQNERLELRSIIKDMIRSQELDVLLTTYTLFERESNKIDRGFLQSLPFHFLVLDEAHSIKNANSSRYQHLSALSTQGRILLSGTPVQNNIEELLALLSFLMPTLFRKDYCELLATVYGWNQTTTSTTTSKEGMKALLELKAILSPFVLRRLKSDVLDQLTEKRYQICKVPMIPEQAKIYQQIIQQYLEKQQKKGIIETSVEIIHQDVHENLNHESNTANTRTRSNRRGKTTKATSENSSSSSSSAKNDLKGVINLCESPISSSTITTTTTPSTTTRNNDITNPLSKDHLTATEAKHLFTTLRKAANHPLLLRIHYSSPEQIHRIAQVAYQHDYFGTQCSLTQVIHEIESSFSDYDIHELCLQFPHYLQSEILEATTLYQSPKMHYLETLLPQLQQAGHRILLFSQWTRLLDLLEILCQDLLLKFLRFDGSTPIKERQLLIDQFNQDSSITIFLLSTKAGGLGINLTSADTVILHDLDFNPENDKQAEDRCHRIGQTKPVTIYKLVTEGTVDEDIYEMGERKRQLSHAVLSNSSHVSGENSRQSNTGNQNHTTSNTSEEMSMISQILSKALSRV